MIATALLIACALLLDRLLGEARRFHPLVGFGSYAARIERRMNSGTRSGTNRRVMGVLAWLLAVSPWLTIAILLWQQQWYFLTKTASWESC